MIRPVFDPLLRMPTSVPHIPGYEFIRELGVGGMATVFLATQSSLERSVAIKVMKREGADENFEKRFLLEGRTMAKLPHRNIVGVYDIVQNETINYIAMEYLGGGTLSDRMRQGLSLAEAISIVVQIAGALQFAHDAGVVHRDLKPANVMFRDAHTPVLTDFGIARQKDSASTRLTQTGMMIGTPTYMSPEQAMGNDVDGRSDQYSLGVLFYEMLTGSPPFSGETPLNVVLAHINQPPPPLPPAFAHFQPILDRMLAKDRENRFPDLTTFVRDLKAMLTNSETLLARLQIDPNQTASEQLRALGFSESQINTGSRRSATGLGASGPRPAPRPTGPGVRIDPPPPAPPPPRSRPRWLVPGVASLGAVLLALVLWIAFGSRDELDPSLRKLVNTNLAVVDRLIDEGKLVAPPGDNANEKLQEVLQIAANLPEAVERQQRIVATLRQQAEAALASKNFAAAEIRVAEALSIVETDTDLLGLRKRIADAKLAAERDASVAALLQRAERARAAGRPYGAGAGDDALTLLRQAIEIDPQHAAARDRLAALTTQSLARARTALDAGRLDEAADLLAAVAAFFANEPAWKQLSATLDQARRDALQKERIEAFIAQARRHVEAGRYAEPAGDNALESLARVAELDPANVAAAALRREIGVALSRRAAERDRAGDPAAALALYDQALQAQPGNAEYVAARGAVEGRLDAREMQLAATLSNARSAINERRYLLPAGNNAREYVEAALVLAPGNADAQRLRESLPELVREAASQLARESRYDDALLLLAEGVKQYPADAPLAALARNLGAERERERAAAVRTRTLADIQGRLAGGVAGVEAVAAVATPLAQLLAQDPADAEALRYRDALLGELRRMLAAATTPARIDALQPLLQEAGKRLGEDAAVIALRGEFEQARAGAAARERERIAAMSGTLVLNAHPWANIDSVVEQSTGANVTLPVDRATPLRLTVPAGTYKVTFKHPQAGKPVVLVAGVQAQKAQVANASFPTLTASEYLSRAGYAK